MRIIRVFTDVCVALCISCTMLLFIVQEDPWVKRQLTQRICKNMSELLQASVTCELASLDIAAGTLIIDTLSLVDKVNKDQWLFSCPRCVIKFSWLEVLTRSRFLAEVACYRPRLYSKLTGTHLSIAEPLKNIMQAPSALPCALKKCSFYNATGSIRQSETENNFLFEFSSYIQVGRTSMRLTGDYTNGTLVYAQESILTNLSGATVIDIDIDTGLPLLLTTQSQAHVSIQGKQEQYTLCGVYKKNTGTFELVTHDRQIVFKLSELLYTPQKWTALVTVQADSKAIAQYITPGLLSDMPVLHGVMQAQLALVYSCATKELTYTGTATCSNMRIGHTKLPVFVSTVQGTTAGVQGNFEVHKTGQQPMVHGTWKAQFWPCLLEIESSLTKMLTGVAGWTLKQGAIQCKLFRDQAALMRWAGNYMLCLTHQTGKNYKNYTVTGSCKGNGQEGTCKGQSNGLEYTVEYALWPALFKKIVLEPYIQLAYNAQTKTLEGTLASKTLKLLAELFGYELQGEGIAKIGCTSNEHNFFITGLLEQASMRVTGLYNMVKSAVINLEIDKAFTKLVCRNSKLELYKGSLAIGQATAVLQGCVCVSAHIPVIFDNCLVSWQKDFFGTFSGAVVGTYIYGGEKSIKGFITLDRSHLRSNLLSLQVQQKLLCGVKRPDTVLLDQVHLALVINNKQPIQIKTPVLESKARIALNVQGTLVSPEISGVIDFCQGTLSFPYKPLYITHARLYLVPGQLDNALIELTAKNKIKKYTVTLHASGPVQQPVCSLDASPTLQEEQIITLLLAGSEEGSLYLVMPAMIMHTIENLVFGSPQTLSHMQRSFRMLLQPLKHVRIRPDTSDPKGGLKGGVEIEINDKLRAHVQSNLRAPQDTQVEIEYTVSDDISIRGVKDERGVLSGELEMRWKF